MKLDKPTLLRLALVLGGCVVLYWALCNLALLGAALGMLAGVLFPLTLGFCIAFVLNVPMRFLERHLFLRTQKPVLKRLRRPLCILISLVFILAVLTAVFWLVVPELVNALVVLANTCLLYTSIQSAPGRPRCGPWKFYPWPGACPSGGPQTPRR